MTERVKELLCILEQKKGEERIDPLERIVNNLMGVKPSEALKFADEGIKICREYKDEFHESTFINRKGICYYYSGDYEKAQEYYGQAAKIDLKIGKQKNYCSNISNIAIIKTIQGDYAAALDIFNECIAIEKVENNIESLSSTYNNMGNIYYKLHDIERSLNYYLKSLKLREEINAENLLLTSYANIGSLLRNNYEPERAKQYIDKGLILCDKLGQDHQRPFLLNQSALILSDEGKHDDALKILEESLEINSRNENKSGMALTYGHIADVCQNSENYEIALETCYKGIELARELKMIDFLINCLLQAAKINTHFDNVDEAGKLLDETEILLQDYKDDLLKKEYNRIRAKLYSKKGDYKTAFEFADKNAALDFTIKENELKQRAQELEIIYSVERKERENEILQQKNMELAERNTDLKKLNQELIETQKSLKEKERKIAVLAMAATANHEINQPLMIIKGSLELLEMELSNISTKGSKHFSNISGSVDRIQKILNTYKTVDNIEYEDYVPDNPMISFD